MGCTFNHDWKKSKIKLKFTPPPRGMFNPWHVQEPFSCVIIETHKFTRGFDAICITRCYYNKTFRDNCSNVPIYTCIYNNEYILIFIGTFKGTLYGFRDLCYRIIKYVKLNHTITYRTTVIILSTFFCKWQQWNKIWLIHRCICVF